MRTTSLLGGAISLAVAAEAACPMMTGELNGRAIPDNHPHAFDRREADGDTDDFLSQFYLNDNNSYLTSDVGGPIADQNSLKAGERGPTLLEDFVFRQKIQHFDHERVRHSSCLILWEFQTDVQQVPERAVHARGAGAHGVFTSYADWSNITAASFLGAAGKETPVFARISTVAGSRGSADTARDVHGFALRFYTDEGNYGMSRPWRV